MESCENLWQLGDTEKVSLAHGIAAQIWQLHARLLEVVSHMDNGGTGTNLGYSNTAALLVHVLRVPRREALHLIAQAADLFPGVTPTGAVTEAPLPQTSAALAAGEISSEAVDVIRKTLKDLPDLDAEKRVLAESVMLEQAAEDDPNALARFGLRVRAMVDPDGPPPVDPEPARQTQVFRYRDRRDGSLEMSAVVAAENAGPLRAMIQECERPRPGDLEDTRTFAERLGDAFAERILKRAANCPDMPLKNGLRTEIAFTISFNDLMRDLDDRILVGDDIYMTAREARRIACDCHLFPAVLGSNSEPLDIAAGAYSTPAHIRRALVLRDKGCAFPGCPKSASVCDAHHIHHWADNGVTHIDNLVLLCPHHHRLIHNSDWTIQLLNNRPSFTPPTYIDPLQRPRTNSARTPLPPRTPPPHTPPLSTPPPLPTTPPPPPRTSLPPRTPPLPTPPPPSRTPPLPTAA
ncbi:DUF222 domain-containing protein [Actinocrispum sp. NPDC049592]|uniref:HNH endonuclease signature motif containing protein n=1 Tax=Actinocrispum sp. NPDC049592 TaxID=3154835 RepID=UPI00342C6B93